MKSKYFIALFIPLLFATLLIPAVSANCEPPPNEHNGCEREPGFTPGFWKHNIRVALGYPGRYSVFDRGPLEGTRVTEAMLLGWCPVATLQLALDDLTARGPGSREIRTAMANAFNDAAGYDPFDD